MCNKHQLYRTGCASCKQGRHLAATQGSSSQV